MENGHRKFQKKTGIFKLKLWSFWDISGSLWGRPKSPKISTNTHRTKLNVCQLNSMAETIFINGK